MTIASLSYAGQTVKAEPLTPAAFAKFGYCISPGDSCTPVPEGAHGLTYLQANASVPVNNYDQSKFATEAPCAFNLQRFAPHATLDRKRGVYTAVMLERHPYTTQTFFPMGVAAAEAAYLVIVAENDVANGNLPDLGTLRAFVARGSQSVTYGAAVWHGSTAALRDHLDMTMFMYNNGVKADEVEVVQIAPGVRIEYE
ncbi:ureidoglycolate hydrolase [Limtongia smithiae]|uniref:ureidoglycolate hydrolase n=1 Tax=Limtongia smithiae TaxID=1125753 RepID=UPI0034CFE0B8